MLSHIAITNTTTTTKPLATIRSMGEDDTLTNADLLCDAHSSPSTFHNTKTNMLNHGLLQPQEALQSKNKDKGQIQAAMGSQAGGISQHWQMGSQMCPEWS
jgi:hypothetical protein